jgi:4-alpha-glucanotransferase
LAFKHFFDFQNMKKKKYIFKIPYSTQWGQLLRVVINPTDLFDEKLNIYVDCSTTDGHTWSGESENLMSQFYYKYEVLNIPNIIEEAARPRYIDVENITSETIILNDFWRSDSDKNNIFYAAAFSEVIFNPERNLKNKIEETTDNNISFTLNSPCIPKNKKVGIVGNIAALGNWATPIILQANNYPEWRIDVFVHDDVGIVEYKYVLIDDDTQLISYWEPGSNRQLPYTNTKENAFQIIHDDGFRYGGYWWKGSGIALPVFSLRTKQGCGIGEFSDLKMLMDLAEKMGMDIIQTLPVNDTLANMTWSDSYPYAAISVYALHPLYINLESITDLSTYNWYPNYQNEKSALNKLDFIDFEAVLTLKLDVLRKLYADIGSKILKSKEVKEYINSNSWVKSYSIFCHLRDKFKTPDFTTWKEYAIFDNKVIDKFWSKNNPSKEVGFYVYVQYLLDQQLKEVKKYGRSKGIVLKGDLPIGIYRHSCDAWINPHLYQMSQQAGAPPDDYAVNGQNWGFPTYNWEEMSKDGFSWWQSRMRQLSTYFDALRIDHILGFFRIWSIPINQISGTLGLFYPRLPLHINEIASYGLKGDINRYTKPYIRTYMLQQMFEKDWEIIANIFLVEVFDDAFIFRPEFDTQQKVMIALQTENYTKFHALSTKILSLLTEVLLIEEPDSNELYFNPRITLHTTYSYKDLDEYSKKAIDKLYVEYFYQRHNEFWKNQATWKLPAIIKASDMLICGEDLGMIPATVPDVMSQLNIIPLEIQRMPKTNTLFGMCNEFDYLTVCSPSCHDMPTIRGWWEGNSPLASKFYHLYMKRDGVAPRECLPEIVKFIINDHLQSKSILAIFPLQDLLGMNDKLKHPNPFAEQINEPANPKHYWRYRLHLDIEDIISNKSFCEDIYSMVKSSGR